MKQHPDLSVTGLRAVLELAVESCSSTRTSRSFSLFLFLHSHSCVSYVNLLHRVQGLKLAKLKSTAISHASHLSPFTSFFLIWAQNAFLFLFCFPPFHCLEADESAASAGEEVREPSDLRLLMNSTEGLLAGWRHVGFTQRVKYYHLQMTAIYHCLWLTAWILFGNRTSICSTRISCSLISNRASTDPSFLLQFTAKQVFFLKHIKGLINLKKKQKNSTIFFFIQH